MTNAPAGILETALYADDLDAMERFYVRVLGLEVVSRVPGRMVTLRCGAGVLLIFDPRATSPEGQRIPSHGTTGAGHVAFVVAEDALPRWRAVLRDEEIPIGATIEWPEGGESLYFRDPAGNSIELAPPTIWGGVGRRALAIPNY